MANYSIDDKFLYEYMGSAENIILENLPKEKDLSHKFSKRFKRKMHRLIKEEKRSPSFNRFVNYGRKVAMIFLIVISLIFATTMSIEALRVRFFEKIIEVLEDRTAITFDAGDEIVPDLVPVASEYVPAGFYIDEKRDTGLSYTIRYSNQEEEIYYAQIVIAHGQILLDTEGVEIETIEIGKQEANIFINKGLTQLYWDDGLYMYHLTSTIDRVEIVKMAESIIKNK